VCVQVALLARYDAFGTSTGKRDGAQAREMKVHMEAAIEKWMEPPPAAIVKPLPAPDGVTKKRRGGKRWRKQKERVAATEMMKQANRMQFGTAEEEYIDGDEMYGLGMLGKDGHGKLKIMQVRLQACERHGRPNFVNRVACVLARDQVQDRPLGERLLIHHAECSCSQYSGVQAASKLSKKERTLNKGGAGGGNAPSTATGKGGSGGGMLSGTQSSLAFSAVQGIELENPNREAEAQADVGGARTGGTESYFSELSGFKTFRKIT
jgi:Prp31 C terminal domain